MALATPTGNRLLAPRNWQIVPSPQGLALIAPNTREAEMWSIGAERHLNSIAANLSSTICIYTSDSSEPIKRFGETNMQKQIPEIDLVGADYRRILEFLLAEREAGKIVVITSNITRDEQGRPIDTEDVRAGRDICHHTNDRLTPQRAILTPAQWTGYNYRECWRRDRNDYLHLNPRYHQLRSALERDGFAPNFEYTLYRPDGALCSYSTTYFLCRNYLEDEVRIGVSDPNDYQVIEAA